MAAVVVAALFLRPSGLVLAGLILLAVAVHLFAWDPERKELFTDDWVEITQVVAGLASAFVGVGLIAAAAAMAGLA
ncbi:MAG: hypothetical protein ACJ72L_17235 [Marmoricola sp.]